MLKSEREFEPAQWGDPQTRQFLSDALFGGRSSIVILHRGERYILRITRKGRLILNKELEARLRDE